MNNILVKNIDFNDRSILVETTKTDVNRYVFFSEETSKLIQELIDRYELTKYLFVNFEEESPTPISVSAIENMIRRLKVKLNIKENISPHKWRHTFATKFAKSNGNMEALRQILGHDNLKTTQKYLHLNKKDIMNAYNDVLDKLTA
jgi:site-specific recombinase XerD